SGPPLAEDDQEQFVSQFLDLFGQELAQHGGQSVAQPDGGLIAVFGDNHVREDDAHRAVTAALAIGRQRDEATRLLADLGSVLTTRIGIHRGFVSRRERSDERMPIAGETVATARRLAEVAPLNAILATADAVEGLSDWLAIQPFTKLTLQGRARPVEAHEVLGTMRAASGGDSRAFVGRDVALADLRDAFGAAGAGTAPTVLAMTGAPGIGKTRLVSEFLARLGVEVGDELQVLRVQPPPRVSYGLWTSLFEEILARAARGHNGKDRGGEVLDMLAAALDPERGALLLQQRTLLDGLIGRDAIEFTGG
ncbi:MAG: hypothetical protein DMF88_13865, partial [Acidobacteria bacterium]